MARNWYSEAIEILVKEEMDLKKIVVEIAKKHPKILIDAHNSVYPESWQSICLKLMKAGQKIQAIKKCREMSGMGLAEAKKAVEILIK